MKHLILTVLAILTAVSGAYAKSVSKAIDTIVIASEKPVAVSNHSFSLQIVGIEYGYEQKLGGSFSMVFRAGMVPSGLYFYGDYHLTELQFSSSLGINIEPRFYTNFGRRARLGKNTFKNSADFVAIKIQGVLSGPFDFSLTPMYGIRRVWGKHWFGEFTAGGRVGIQNGLYLAPYLQYRFGFVF